MGPVSGTVVYLLVWWVVFLCALPFREDPQEDKVPGTPASAPENPHLKKKFLAATLISAIIWVIIWYLMYIEIIDFRELAAEMPLV